MVNILRFVNTPLRTFFVICIAIYMLVCQYISMLVCLYFLWQ